MKKFITMMLAVVLIAALALSACNSGGGNTGGGGGGGSGDLVERGWQSDLAKDVITLGGVRSSTGANAYSEQTAFGPQYRMWVDLLNKDGGIYVKSLDRKVPIETQIYDDGSDITKTTQLFEQLLAQEKPDIIVGPVGSSALFSCVPIAQKYDYLLLASEGGAKELEKYIPDNPNFFSILSYSETQVPALVKLFGELGVESVYCAYIDDLHGTEYWGATVPLLEAAGIEILGSESVPLEGNFDADAVVNNAMRLNPDAFLCYTYPGGAVPITLSSVKLGYNPNLFLTGPGACYDFFGNIVFGDLTNESLDGMMGWGAWNEKSSAGAKEFYEFFRDYWTEEGYFWKNPDGTFNMSKGDDTVYVDWWGHICYYAVVEILQQAIENAGQLNDDGRIDNLTLVEYIKNSTFKTYMNPELKFTNNILTDDMYLGNIGQWQDGVFEVVDSDARRTADPLYPKPAWK